MDLVLDTDVVIAGRPGGGRQDQQAGRHQHQQFIATAVAEKLAAMDAEQFFKVRQDRAKLGKFDAIMKRKTGQPPRAGDEAQA